MMEPEMAHSRTLMNEDAGRNIIAASWAGTVLFVASAFAAVASESFGNAHRVVCLALFAVGSLIFLAAFMQGVGRSRESEIAVSNLFFLSGSAPKSVRVQLFASLAIQVVVGFLTASLRPYTLLAFGILVPMYGLGMAGMWGAEHGVFPDRIQSPASTPPKATPKPPSEANDVPGDQSS